MELQTQDRSLQIMQQKLKESLETEQDLLADHPMTTIDEAQIEWDEQEGKLNLKAFQEFANKNGIQLD